MRVLDDPFIPSSAKDLYVLRIEAYPQSIHDKFFCLKTRKQGKPNRYEVITLDKQNQLEFIETEKIYEMIVKSYPKTHINRQVQMEEEEKDKVDDPQEQQELLYLESDFEYAEDCPKYPSQSINELLKYDHQSMISAPPAKEEFLQKLNHQLKAEHKTFEFINFFP